MRSRWASWALMRASSISRLRMTVRIERHLRRDLQQVRQQTPRQRALAVELARRRGLQLLELAFAPVRAACRCASASCVFRSFFALSRPGSLGVFGNLVVLLLPAQDLDVVLVGQRVDVAPDRRIAAGPRGRRSAGRVLASISFCLPGGPLTSDDSTTERAGRLMPDASVSVQMTHGQQLAR